MARPSKLEDYINMLGDCLRTCYFLLPGYDLDEFPRSAPPAEAESLLAGWVALWHPKLIKACNGLPSWLQAQSAPGDLEGLFLVVPETSADDLSDEYRNIDEANALLLELSELEYSDWQALQDRYLEQLGWGSDALPESTQHLRDDFAALGYGYLQVQLMTRQLRYTSNLDPTLLSEQLCVAAESVLSGNAEEAESQLQVCFDTLGQERDHYYSLDVNLLDITLLAPSTLGKSLRRQLESEQPTSFLASAGLLRQLKQKSEETLAALSERVASEKAAIVGGLDEEHPHALCGRESFVRELARGRAAYQSLGFAVPNVYSQLAYGIAAEHASVLKRSGFAGALLIPWSEGRYPEGSQAKLSWESPDGVFLQAIASEVLDASSASSFLAFGWEIGEALDQQHVPTVILAHWPGRTSPYFELLQIVARRTTALGRLMTTDQYFTETEEPYHQERLSGSGFRYDWLGKAEDQVGLIDRIAKYHQLKYRLRSLQNLANLNRILESPPPGGSQEDRDESSEEPVYAPETRDWFPELANLFDKMDGSLQIEGAPFQDIETGYEKATQQVLQNIARRLTGKAKSDDNEQGTGDSDGLLLLNPRSTPQRFRVKNPSGKFFANESWHFTSGMVGHDRYTSIDVPSLGFVLAPLEDYVEESGRDPHLAEVGGVLQNEFLELQIDTKRGHLRSFHVPAKRGNRLSLMLGFRRQIQKKGKKKDYEYSEMVATDVKMLTSSNVCGLIRATGKLEFDGTTVARFEMDYEVWRGSRVLEVVVRLFDVAPYPLEDLWDSAFVLRVAWANESALLKTYTQDSHSLITATKFVAPQIVEIDEAEYRTHYLPNGLAFHRRTDLRFLETVLPVRPGAGSEAALDHRIGIGVDLPQPMSGSADYMDQRYAAPLHGSQISARHGWMITADATNVVIDLESPLMQEDKTVGVRLLITECAGRATSTKIRLPHNVANAKRVDYLGQVVGQVSVSEDSIIISLRANEQCNVDVVWA